MSMHTTAVPAARPRPRTGARRPATFLDAVAGEWIKIRTHRGVLLALLAGVVVTVVAGANNSSANANALRAGESIGTGSSLVWVTQFGMKFGVIAFAIAGALAMTAEYSSGMIRTSLTAVPSRGRLLAAKATAFAAPALAAGLLASTVAFATGSSLLTDAGAKISLSDPGVPRALVGGALFLATSGLFALALGALLRHPVATVAGIFAVYILPQILGRDLGRSFPFEAGLDVTLADYSSPFGLRDSSTAWSGYFILLTWTAATAAVAYALIRRRDA
ncbi:ABC transporter permease subunit [Streptomyces sp. WAC06614]|uniref:ABC transporter permease subunit n=1 Tax=Streptomyces sp. WAC06614 TaxID=2487416 RepID=UPI000F771D74|nr:ABC transporter permease subunit [Streptomyces sp. WAC06614]RSS78658.1 hypothetical protein EF918_20185 [Streptomyces sp. WAC06614]